MYRSQIFASNNHQELEKQINDWFENVKPGKIHSVNLAADGMELTYCVLVLYYVARGKD